MNSSLLRQIWRVVLEHLSSAFLFSMFLCASPTLGSSDWAQLYCHPLHVDPGPDIVKVTLFVFMFNTHDCLGVVFGSQ